MKLSQRINNLKTSPVRKLLPFAEIAKEKGHKIIHLNIGQPDIETPSIFFDAINKWSQHEKVLSYAHSAGLKELREEIVHYFAKQNISFELDDIMIVNGGSEAFQFILTALFDEGDEILVPEPYYANYQSFYSTLGIGVRPIHTKAEEGFHLPSLEEMEKSITPKVKAIMFSSPANPTGTVYTKEEVERIGALAEKYDITIISDEVYREFAYGDVRAISFGEYPQWADRTVIIDSVSKRFSACGARIGCVISKNREFINAIYRQCQARLAAPTLEMVGCQALYTLNSDFFIPIRQEYMERRDVLFEELTKIEGVFSRKPEGAFYCLVGLPVKNAEHFASWLLSEFAVNGETVMVAPAEGFYATKGLGTNEVRICYALEKDVLRRAMHILKEGLKTYLALEDQLLSK
ncbi:MAG: pyridoxal phosphate-dependent aminotransferase [Brevinema sp.]